MSSNEVALGGSTQIDTRIKLNFRGVISTAVEYCIFGKTFLPAVTEAIYYTYVLLYRSLSSLRTDNDYLR